jgi:hypothetical protein
VRAHLKQRGYLTAEVTIDGDDWAYNPPYARCTDRKDTAALAELRKGLVKAHVDELRFVRALTQTLTGRDVRHVLLLHIGAAEADAMDELLTAYEREGVRLVDVRTALADPFYAIDPHLPYAFGAAFPYVVAKARGVPLPPHPKREVDVERRERRAIGEPSSGAASTAAAGYESADGVCERHVPTDTTSCDSSRIWNCQSSRASFTVPGRNTGLQNVIVKWSTDARSSHASVLRT